LDEKERSLNEDNLLISDGQKALAIAGVMGGRESEISAETKAIILEAANFEAATVRKTSQKLGLRTESSLRFEKSLDPQLPPLAVARFLVLLKKVCPEMKISSRLVDINNTKNEIKNVELDLNWLEEKIGQEIPRGRVSAILERLGFTVLEGGGDLLKINIPSWRATKDVSGKEDVAEEILRLYGYDNIASCLQRSQSCRRK
jgi:phenylalanyl-tRNA synthetase beta chain